MKLATWNLEWLAAEPGAGPVPRRLEDYARLRRYAERLDADVVALQEVAGEAAVARVFDAAVYDYHVASGREPQRTGFAFKKRLGVRRLLDFKALDVGRLRVGTELAVRWGGGELRLMSVHLKSGCFSGPLGERRACRKLAQQLPALEAWIDARAAEGGLFAVLGDFNRRLFARPDDPFWLELDDGVPPEADLDSPTRGRVGRCWDGERPHFIDHLVLGRSLASRVVPDSFGELLYDAADRGERRVLSDHCPVVVVVDAAATPQTTGLPDDARRGPNPRAPIRGNRGRGGERIYHLPGCPSYAAVKIDPERGERTFLTEAEAREAGWRRAPNCP